MRVLIVDDEPDILQAIRLSWLGEDVELDLATSAQEALGAPVPDVLLTDYRMAGMDGLELIARMRERHPGLPAILMTAAHDPEVATVPGIEEIVRKPFDTDALLALVRKAVTRVR